MDFHLADDKHTSYLIELHCRQRWAQIHQNEFKINIQNTVWEKVFKYKYSILYFENTQNIFEIGHPVK